ncbi:hypothetical protein BLNAU_12695 [Blattamonas nauphoetae]|uniref:Uncharacterized protein n=1 Tax=Blattamonas nauphoetae TaxID=2049346 RepID=A0ABQ9XJ27_9EUKA|nr:hypothetical protein BLNAU_12695 [Blattamonas nauphoetae]
MMKKVESESSQRESGERVRWDWESEERVSCDWESGERVRYNGESGERARYNGESGEQVSDKGKVENGTRSIERMEGERDKLTSVKMNLNEPIKRKENRTTPLTFQGNPKQRYKPTRTTGFQNSKGPQRRTHSPSPKPGKTNTPTKGVEKNLDSSFQEQLEELVNRRKEVENMWMSRKLSVKQVEDRKGLMTVNRTEIAGNVKSGEEANQREDEKLLSWVKMLIETMKIWNSINFKKLMGNLELKEGQTFGGQRDGEKTK